MAVRPVQAGSEIEQAHRPELDLPILADDPTAVPIKVGLDHPMEPDHYIRAIEVVVETDPVPRKGKFLFTPLNGRPWVAFQMRSGAGGVVTASVECSRHGTFRGTRELRVIEGGCTAVPEKAGRERPGNPMLRIPRAVRMGEVVEVRAKVDHASDTGLTLRNGRFVRVRLEFYLTRMLAFLDAEKVSEFQMTSAVSPNPLIRFPMRVVRSGVLRVVFVNNQAQAWEVSQPIGG